MANGNGFIMMQRSDELGELISRATQEFKLSAIIAYRAFWGNGYNRHDLQPGEALIGDFTNYGMTRQEYRTALNNLKKAGFITTRATNKGTIAKLCDSRLYDLNLKPNQPSKEPESNHQATTEQPLSINKEFKTTTNMSGLNFSISDSIRSRFSSASVLSQFAADCDNSEAIMQAYLEYAGKQSGVNNPVGMAVKLAAERFKLPDECSIEGCRRPRVKFTVENGKDLNLCSEHYKEYRESYPNGNGQFFGTFIKNYSEKLAGCPRFGT